MSQSTEAIPIMSTKALQPGSLVLITGVNGYIASHIADQLMSLGYRVRGTARDSAKVATMIETFQKRHPPNSFEGFVLTDMTSEGAFEQAVAGCSGVLHVATDVSFSPDPNQVVPQVVKGVQSLLQAAAQDATVKRFVYTSSSIAAVRPSPGELIKVDSDSWNELDVRDAWAPPPYEASRAFPVYGASKVEGERAAWAFMKAGKRNFVLNTVLPNFAVGPRFNSEQAGSTSGWVRDLWKGKQPGTDYMLSFPAQWSVDVRDVASTHVAALLEADVGNERLFAFAEPYNYSRIVSTLKAIDPAKSDYPPPPENEGEDMMRIDTKRAEELLNRLGGRGFRPLEESLRDQLAAERAGF